MYILLDCLQIPHSAGLQQTIVSCQCKLLKILMAGGLVLALKVSDDAIKLREEK
ncbi:MAG: hypothetical protein ACYCYE_14680 [Clostridia bacterium]